MLSIDTTCMCELWFAFHVFFHRRFPCQKPIIIIDPQMGVHVFIVGNVRFAFTVKLNEVVYIFITSTS